MVAHVYTNPRPFETPHSHLVGFARFLHLLGQFDWENYPLIVDIDNELGEQDYKSIQRSFDKQMRAQVCTTYSFASVPRERASFQLL